MIFPIHDAFFIHPNDTKDLISHAAFSLAEMYDKTSLLTIVQDFSNNLSNVKVSQTCLKEKTIIQIYLPKAETPININIASYYKDENLTRIFLKKLRESIRFIR